MVVGAAAEPIWLNRHLSIVLSLRVVAHVGEQV